MTSVSYPSSLYQRSWISYNTTSSLELKRCDPASKSTLRDNANTSPAGSLTYLSVTALSLYLPTLRARAAASLSGSSKPAFPSLLAALNGTGGPNGLNWRQVVLSTAVSIWATRLGTYLFQRVIADGHDSRVGTHLIPTLPSL